MIADPTEKRLFFQLLHTARMFKPLGLYSRGYLAGMRHAMIKNREDFRIADAMRSIWTHQSSFAE